MRDYKYRYGTEDGSGLAYNSKYNNYLNNKFGNLIQLGPF
jgi:hypothetical protein